MKVKYFRDTDTALLEFSSAPVEATREINEDVYVDLDANGNVVKQLRPTKADGNVFERDHEKAEKLSE